MDGVGMDDFDLQAVQPLKTKVFAAYHRLCNDFTTCTDRDKKTSMSERETERARERAVKSVWTSFQSVVKRQNAGPTSHANAELSCPGQYA